MFPTHDPSLAQEALEGYVLSPEWAAKINSWGAGYVALVNEAILSDMERGAGRRAIASHVRDVITSMPRYAAETLTRTLQVTSYRDATVAMEGVNGGLLVGKIRIAKLDDRTCLSCISLHGTELEIGERVDDHYNGRCTEWYRVPGGRDFPETMQADSSPGHRVFVPWQTGNDWFKSLPPERQAQQRSFVATPAKLAAYRSGVPLSDFVHVRQDDLFGRQVFEASLRNAVPDPTLYYVRNNNGQ